MTGKPLSGDGRFALLPAAQAPLFSPSPGWLKYSFLLLAHVAQVFIPISGSNIGSHLAQIFVDIHNCYHFAIKQAILF